jgi:hypothetical protein
MTTRGMHCFRQFRTQRVEYNTREVVELDVKPIDDVDTQHKTRKMMNDRLGLHDHGKHHHIVS